ncbi:MAG: TRAP transporter small permease [Dehalococcoidia bacterium]|nr:TRAP transporter small permease [Dehalococcoidia bacterium]
MAQQIEAKISLVSQPLYVGAYCLLALLVLLTTVDVIDRRFFGASLITGAYELSGLFVSVVCFATISYVELMRRHLKIDVITQRLPRRPQAILSAIMYFLYLGVICLLTWAMLTHGLDVMHSGKTSVSLAIPLYPFYFVGTFGCVLLILMVLAHFLLYVVEASKKGDTKTPVGEPNETPGEVN